MSRLPSRAQALKRRRNVKKSKAFPSRSFATRSIKFINPPGLRWSVYNILMLLFPRCGNFGVPCICFIAVGC